jgi:lipoprotein-releasing system ATP-binding protein
MIEATNIHKSYGHLHVLKGVNLLIEKGEFVSIIGKSGAGKSTLLHILGTLDKADKGSIRINEVEVFKLNKKKLAGFRNKNIGFCLPISPPAAGVYRSGKCDHPRLDRQST